MTKKKRNWKKIGYIFKINCKNNGMEIITKNREIDINSANLFYK